MMHPDWDYAPSERDTARDMTMGELEAWLRHQRWPCCGALVASSVRGPTGGASVNLACPNCDMRLNVTDPEGEWRNMAWGQVIREPRE